MKTPLISYYKNALSRECVNVPLLSFLTSTKHRAAIDTLRAAVAAGEPDSEIKRLKMGLPAGTISGVFAGEHKATNLVQHSGFIALDIDFKENTHVRNFGDVKSEMCKLEEVYYCGLSCTGRGFYAVVPLRYPNKHLEQFKALSHILNGMGLVIDNACKDVSRLRFYSHDANHYLNTAAKPFEGVYSEIPPKYPKKTAGIFTSTLDSSNHLHGLCNWVQNTGIDFTPTYGIWFEVGAALANEMGEQGRCIFHILSSNHANYTYPDTDKFYSELLRHSYPFKFATIWHYAKLAGYTYKAGALDLRKEAGSMVEVKHIPTKPEILAYFEALNPSVKKLRERLGFELVRV